MDTTSNAHRETGQNGADGNAGGRHRPHHGEGSAQDLQLIGGTAVISRTVEDAVRGHVGVVQRLSGADRYATSVAVADAAVAAGADAGQVWVATGTNWPDGLTAGAAAAHDTGVLMLVHGTDPGRSTVSHTWLHNHQPEHVRVAGGPAAVSEAVYAVVAAR